MSRRNTRFCFSSWKKKNMIKHGLKGLKRLLATYLVVCIPIGTTFITLEYETKSCQTIQPTCCGSPYNRKMIFIFCLCCVIAITLFIKYFYYSVINVGGIIAGPPQQRRVKWWPMAYGIVQSAPHCSGRHVRTETVSCQRAILRQRERRVRNVQQGTTVPLQIEYSIIRQVARPPTSPNLRTQYVRMRSTNSYCAINPHVIHASWLR